MGFGLLFIGYFIALLMSVNNYGFAFEIVGFAVMFTAIGKLTEYKHSLSRTALPLFLMTLCSLFEGGRVLAELGNTPLALFSEGNAFFVSLFAVAIGTVFQIMLFLGIGAIAGDAEETKLSRRSVMCCILVGLVCTLELLVSVLSNIPSLATTAAVRYLSLFAVLIRILYPLPILAFIFSCYASLCAPEDMEMKQRPSRFAFVNRWREEREKKAEEVEKLREQYQKRLEVTPPPRKKKKK